MKRTIVVTLGIIIIAVGGWFAYGAMKDDDANISQTNVPVTTQESEVPEAPDTIEKQPAPALTFTNPKKSAHYVSNTPAHGSTLDQPPAEVVLTFNFDLAENSTISITKDGKEYGSGGVGFGVDKLTMRKAVANGGSGVYTVTYNACWPDGSCHDGQFQFGVK